MPETVSVPANSSVPVYAFAEKVNVPVPALVKDPNPKLSETVSLPESPDVRVIPLQFTLQIHSKTGLAAAPTS